MLLGCIADDFTGATDLANTLCKGGMTCVQINGLAGCSVENAARLTQMDAVIVALKSRSNRAGEAIEHSLAALNWLQGLGCEKFFFKYCSTFDSTDQGNIGPVAEALMSALDTNITIACPAAPENGRTVYQGHLFINSQLLSETGMRHHPVTPMTRSDLVQVLARQSKGKVALIDQRTVSAGAKAISKELIKLSREGKKLVIADAISDNDLRNLVTGTSTMPLITGGSGLALGLPELYRDRLQEDDNHSSFNWPTCGSQLVISGSCSQATLRQVVEFQKITPSWKLDPFELHKDRDGTIARALSFLAENSHTPALIYSSVDTEILAQIQVELGQEQASDLIETSMGKIAHQAVANGVRKLVVAGGETSGAVVSALRLDALAFGPEIAPGVPWTLSLKEPHIALALKSGNFGTPDFFTRAFEVLP